MGEAPLATQLGAPMRCAGCNAEVPRRSGTQLRCPACRNALQRQQTRDWRERTYRDRVSSGARVLGRSVVACTRCGGPTVFSRGNVKYCPPCREAEKRDRARARTARRYAADPSYRLRSAISARVRQCLKAGAKAGRSLESILGYSMAELRDHLERQFRPGMSWDTYGSWHIDHIVPVTAYRFTAPADPDFIACWALSNLQPLWAADNIRKGGVRPARPRRAHCG